MKKISIIIPVYNIAPYIERCITSIINQEPSDLEAEIILVDDGSTDESGSICDKISEEHHNVSVIHQQNAGQSDARNNGLKKATGDYIWFVDGDDYIDAESLKNINSLIENIDSDIINIGYKQIYKDGSKNTHISEIGTQHEVVNGVIALSKLCAIPAWASIIKHNFLIENNLSFVKGIIHEDFEFGIKCYSLAKSVSFLPYSIYYYCCDRVGSTVNVKTAFGAIGYASCAVSISKFIENHNFSKSEKNQIMKIVAMGVVYSLRRMTIVHKNDIEYNKGICYYRHHKKHIANALFHYTFYYKIIGLIMQLNPLIAHQLFILTESVINKIKPKR